MRKISIHFICIMVVAAIAASMAVAYNSWLPDFNNEYLLQEHRWIVGHLSCV